MALTDKLSAIGAAIREKTGKTELIKLDDMPQEIASITTGGGDDLYHQMIDGSISGEVIFPEGITTIGKGAFYTRTNITKVVIPDSVTTIGESAFQGCSNLTEIIFGSGILKIPYQVVHSTKVTEIVIPHGVTTLGDYALGGLSGMLTKLWMPNTITKFGVVWLSSSDMKVLTNVIFEKGYNCTTDISKATRLTVESLIGMFEALADLTGQTAKTLTIGATNIAKLTEEQIAIATQKNWTIA